MNESDNFAPRDEYDDFLNRSVEQESETAAYEQAVVRARANFEKILIEQGWEPLFGDTDRRADLFHTYWHTERDRIDSMLKQKFGAGLDTELEEAFEPDISHMVEHQLDELGKSEELSVIEIAKVVMFRDTMLENEIPEATIDELMRENKVNIFSRLIVKEGYDPNSAFVHGLNRFLPGAPVTTNDPDVQSAINSELEAVASTHDSLTRTTDFIEAAFDATDIILHETVEDTETLRSIVHAIASEILLFETDRTQSDEARDSRREAYIREVGTKAGLKSEYIEQLVAHFNDIF